MTAPLVAVVGSGPSAFYAAEELLKAGVSVDMIERLPTPFGLVRSGVAPDHAKIKSITGQFEKILSHPALRFYGNVEVGRDVSIDDLRVNYDAVILACGAPKDVPLGVEGEDLLGSFAAGTFVAWYNGHPDFRDAVFPFHEEAAVIIGNGNVALDVARILLSPLERLRDTDIPSHALEALKSSRVREVHVVGRRGPVQASLASAELKEVSRIEFCSTHVAREELELDAACAEELERPEADGARRNLALLRGLAAEPPREGGRQLHLHFRASPIAFLGRDRVCAVRLMRNRLNGAAGKRRPEPTGETYDLQCGFVVRSVGFRAHALDGAPFDAERGIVPNRGGRVIESGQTMSGLYVTGWMKRGSNGVIGTNRVCGRETARAVMADLPGRVPTHAVPKTLEILLRSRGVDFVSNQGWRNIDAVERRVGVARGKPREKLTRFPELLEAARYRPESTNV